MPFDRFFARFIAVSLLFHALVIAALSVSARKQPAVTHWEVTLVSRGDIGDYPSAQQESAGAEKPSPAQMKPAREETPFPAPAKMAVEAEKPVAEEATLTKEERLAALRAKERLMERRRLREVIQVRKSPTPGAGSGAPGPKGAQSSDPSFLDAYGTEVGSAIKRNWFYTGTDPLEALVNVTILSDGTLIFRGFEKKSGDARFDDSLVNAIRRTAKVPPPPFELETVMRFYP